MLVDTIRKKYQEQTLILNAEDFDVQELRKNRSVANYKRIIGNTKLLIIDETQVLPNIGQILKLMIDNFPDLTIIATGSSSFDLANKTGDPLTRRSIHYHLNNQQEVDLIEVENGRLAVFEFKYSANKKVKIPAAFATAYPDTAFQVISRNNYLEWITI